MCEKIKKTIKAAKAGDIEAMFYLAWAYTYSKDGLNCNFDEARYWLDKAVKLNDPHSIIIANRFNRCGNWFDAFGGRNESAENAV